MTDAGCFAYSAELGAGAGGGVEPSHHAAHAPARQPAHARVPAGEHQHLAAPGGAPVLRLPGGDGMLHACAAMHCGM